MKSSEDGRKKKRLELERSEIRKLDGCTSAVASVETAMLGLEANS